LAQQNRNAYTVTYNRNANVYHNGSAAPKMKPAPQRRPNLELVQKTRQTAAQVRQQTAADTRRAIKVMLIAVAILAFMAVAIYSRVQLDEINREIKKVEQKIELAESDSIRINNELNSIVSINNVEDYAVNELGMVKVQDYQVVYVDLSAEDYVAKANGKDTGLSSVINKK
jgi:cell division protein FtsL